MLYASANENIFILVNLLCGFVSKNVRNSEKTDKVFKRKKMKMMRNRNCKGRLRLPFFKLRYAEINYKKISNYIYDR